VRTMPMAINAMRPIFGLSTLMNMTARRDRGQVFLRCALAVSVRVVVRAEVLKQRLAIIRPRYDERLADHAGYGRVPAAVAERGYERLVDRPIYELRCEVVVREHVEDRIRLALDPELRARRDAAHDLVCPALVRVRDHVVVIRARDRSHPLVEAEAPREERVPARVPAVWRLGVALEQLLELALRRLSEVRRLLGLRKRVLAELAILIRTEAGREHRRGEVLAPYDEDAPDVLVDLRALEDDEAAPSSHQPVCMAWLDPRPSGMKWEVSMRTEDCADRHTHDAHLQANICPSRRGLDGIVEDSTEVFDVVNLSAVSAQSSSKDMFGRLTCGAPVGSFSYCGLCGTWLNIVANSIRRRVFVLMACLKSCRTGCSSVGFRSACSIACFTHFWCVSCDWGIHDPCLQDPS
jgi:hypothetical protein